MKREELQKLAADARPRLTWRIGISGHRNLESEHLDRLRRSIERILADAEAALRQMLESDGASNLFAPEPPLMKVVSALAIGADQIVADAAMRRKLPLVAPLPFHEHDYRRDFGKDEPEFLRSLEYARRSGAVIELDGEYETDATRNAGYMAVGEFVVRNCDVLIAIWNGKEARGHGGTGDVVPYARECGVPVVHIWSEGRDEDTRILNTSYDDVPYTAQALAALIKKQVLPDLPQRHKENELEYEKRKQRQASSTKRYFSGEPLSFGDKPLDFVYGGPFEPRMHSALVRLSGLYPRFAKLLGKGESKTVPVVRDPPCGTNESTTRYLFAHHHRVDVLASFYGNVHRSAFLLVYALGAFALSFAVAALFTADHTKEHAGFDAAYLFTGLELIVLLVLAAIVRMDNRGWRDRWLEYRLLAEMLREADLLAQIGRPMPIGRLDEMAEDLPGRAWVRNAYCAIVRASGFVSLKFDQQFLSSLRDYAADTRLADQVKYHETAVSRNEAVSHALRRIGEFAFWGTVGAALTKLLLYDFAKMFGMSLLAGLLPAVAYASFGIRNQAEFEIVSRRSERMIVKLERHRVRLKGLKDGRLTSGALGREILKAAAVMRHDAADWASIFEVKETEK